MNDTDFAVNFLQSSKNYEGTFGNLEGTNDFISKVKPFIGYIEVKTAVKLGDKRLTSVLWLDQEGKTPGTRVSQAQHNKAILIDDIQSIPSAENAPPVTVVNNLIVLNECHSPDLPSSNRNRIQINEYTQLLMMLDEVINMPNVDSTSRDSPKVDNRVEDNITMDIDMLSLTETPLNRPPTLIFTKEGERVEYDTTQTHDGKWMTKKKIKNPAQKVKQPHLDKAYLTNNKTFMHEPKYEDYITYDVTIKLDSIDVYHNNENKLAFIQLQMSLFREYAGVYIDAENGEVIVKNMTYKGMMHMV
ncbi:hypothetical protein RclHR1_02220019 [Rhizophagus clarus]|uniref:Uncharacterized protein n=1 Tax=Rhizophagus clarus TaxID=94130 RepID=A0A2Z6R7L4_9GLOM|nr:hypothetical protein RclHR1_02220019 [Rhizophagus clarus]